MNNLNVINCNGAIDSGALSIDLATNQQDKADWAKLNKEAALIEFVRNHQDWIDWKRISRYQALSEAFIREFQGKVDWESISLLNLSDDFVREFKHKIDFYIRSIEYDIPIDLLREFQDKDRCT